MYVYWMATVAMTLIALVNVGEPRRPASSSSVKYKQVPYVLGKVPCGKQDPTKI